MIRFLALFMCLSVVLAGFAFTVPAVAQEEALPTLPAPIQNLVDEGAQIRYLGKDHGLDSWLTIKNGVEQYFYVLPDQSAFVMGVLFDKEGKLVTVRQVDRLRSQGDTLLDSLAEFPVNERGNKEEAFAFKTPSEQMFADIEGSNWVPLGLSGAPVVYSFIDPQCPHCHDFVNALRKAGVFEQGRLQLRLVPVGFRDETRAQAAFLIATPDPQGRFFRHLDGDKTALPARSGINEQGVQRNMAIMQSWKFDVTPMIIYRDVQGNVKLIRGTPENLDVLLKDVGA